MLKEQKNTKGVVYAGYPVVGPYLRQAAGDHNGGHSTLALGLKITAKQQCTKERKMKEKRFVTHLKKLQNLEGHFARKQEVNQGSIDTSAQHTFQSAATMLKGKNLENNEQICEELASERGQRSRRIHIKALPKAATKTDL